MAKVISNKPEQQQVIDQLVPELKFLRTVAGLSQREIAEKIGVHRETYSYIEKMRRPMSWTIYLAMMCYFMHNPKTKNYLDVLNLRLPEIQ